MGNFLEERARQTHSALAAWEGARIVRYDELARIQFALSSAIEALVRAKPTERVTQSLDELSEAKPVV